MVGYYWIPSGYSKFSAFIVFVEGEIVMGA